MLDNKFVLLFITCVWMSGLFAIVLTLAHMMQDRRYHWRDEGYTWGMPRILAPLYASLATFCLGLALYAYVSHRQISLWLTIVWAALAISFAARMIRILFIGVQHGWDSRLNSRLVPLSVANYGEHGIRIPIWLSVTGLLLLVNLYLLGSWESTHMNAFALAERLSGIVRAESTPAPRPTLVTSRGKQIATPDTVTKTLSSTPVGITVIPTVTVQPTLESRTIPPTPTVTEEVTPTISLVPTLVPQNTPSPAVKPVEVTVTVKSARGANVREAPNLSANIVTVLAPAAIAPVLGRTADNKWFYIALQGGETGWISIQVVQPSETINFSPVVNVP